MMRADLESIVEQEIISVPEALVLLTHYRADLVEEFFPPVLTIHHNDYTYFYKLKDVFKEGIGHFYFEKTMTIFQGEK